MPSPRLRDRQRKKIDIRRALKRGHLVVTLRKKVVTKIDRASKRGNEKKAAKAVAATGDIRNAVKLGRDLKAAGDEDVAELTVDAIADCVTAMDTDKSPFEVEKEASQEKQNQANYLAVTALKGRRGRAPTGKDIRVDAKTTVADRKYHKELKRATRAGKRKPYRPHQTGPTHARAVKKVQDSQLKYRRKRRESIVHALKATDVATPRDCRVCWIRDGSLEFDVDHHLYSRMPKDTDNSPTTAEKAAERAKDFRAYLNAKTHSEKMEERRKRLPDMVYESKVPSRAGQFYIALKVRVTPRRKKTKTMSVVKPGTNGFYMSAKAAAKVRDDWIKLKQPRSWLVPGKK
jgi:hypothetical protein